MVQQDEFLLLFLQHQLSVRAFIAALIRDPHAREDVFQEVALVLWHEFPRYDRGRPFGAWARGIAANKVMQRWARDRGTPVPFPPEAIQALLDAYDHTEADDTSHAEALRQCLDMLPERSRRLLELRYEHALKLAQIADRLRSTQDAVHKALSRLRERLSECIRRRLAEQR